jgi:hypothetical protein
MQCTWLRAAGAIAFCLATTNAAKAAIDDYEFKLVERHVRLADGAVITVRLVDKRSGQPVSGAVIFAKRIDMAPDGMETMAAPIDALASPSPGLYRFRTNLTMAGNWQLSLAAKIQGETGTLVSKLVLEAVQ